MAFDRVLVTGLCSGAVAISMAAAVMSESAHDTSTACKESLFHALTIWAIVTVSTDALPIAATAVAACCCRDGSSSTEAFFGIVVGSLFAAGVVLTILGGLVLSALTLGSCKVSVSVCVVPGTLAQIMLGVMAGYGIYGSKKDRAEEEDEEGVGGTGASASTANMSV